MLDSTRTMEILETHRIQFPSGLDRKDVRGGWINGTQYVWFTYGANIDLYSTVNRCVESSRSFSGVQTNESLKINFVREVDNSEKIINLLLVGCSFKSSGILFVCQLPKLTTICCIALPNPVTFISTILNKSLSNDQLCNELKIMSTILLVGMATGEVYAIDLKEHYIKNQLETNKIVVNELKPSKLFIIKNNDNCQKAKQISNCDDFHLAMFLNEAYCTDYKKLYSGKLNFSISSLSYNEKINAIAIGYSTGHLELWDCKVTLSYTLKMPKYNMPITHITFLEPSYNPRNLCYLWVIQSNNSRLPNATMIALKYEQKTMMSNGCLSFKVFKENCIELEMSLWREAGIGQCISALTLCNDTLVRNSTDMNEHSEIKLFAMLMEIRQNVNASPESYIFLFDINQWYKAQTPSNINHLKVSNSFASFVKLPHNASYLDLNISNKTLRPFGYNFRNNVEELYSPSSIYFECDCLLDNEIIRFKHAGVQQEILDQLLLKNWRSLINPTLIFNQCLQTNLRPFFWDKTDDYINYNLLDKVHFLVALIVENEITSVFNACAEEFKNRTNIFCEPILLLLMHCLWNHFTLVKNYADQLCVSLFDYSGNLFCNENENMLYKCLSQMLHVVHFYESMHSADNIQILNVNLMNQEKIMKGVIQYFHSLIYFIHFKLLPKLIEGDSMSEILQFDFFSLVQYSNKRRAEFGDLPLYLIDAVINNEPYQLIEQWQLECDNESNGLYPPSSIKNLLMINLNTELPHIIKNFIITYFLIDACYLQEMNEIIKNILNDISKKNNRLYKLCGASWFLDHDMFENAMLIFTNYNEWLVDDDSWNWFHWNVLKLLVFKEQYYWAQNYLDLFEIKLINLDDHKFYVNLQIINQNCFDALSYMHSRDINEKNILFEYIFEQCRNTNQLQKILNYPLDEDEKILFFSCLQKFDDTKSIQFKFLFQEKRYSEALEVYKLISITRNFNTTSVLIGTFTNIIPSTNRRELHKKIYPDEEIKNMFIMDNLFNIKNTDVIGHSEFFQNNLIIPDVIYNDEAIDKSRPILDENIDKSNLKELDITLESENKSEKPTTSLENENCLEKEEINSMSGDEDVEKLEQSSKNHNRINNDNCNLEKPNTSLEGKSNLKEVDIVILNEGIVENTFKPDVSSNCEYKDNLESPIVRPPDICEQSKVKLLQSLENTTTEYNDMLDYNNPEYLTDSQSNILENPTPCIGGLAKENHSIDNNQVCEEEYENTFGNIINGNKTLFLVKEDYYGTKLLENEDKNSSAPNYSLDIDNNKDDLCNDLNEFNLIPEYNLNYHNMIGDNEIQQKLISFNETLLENCNVKVQAKKNGTQDSAIDNHEEIVTDEISEKIESFSVSPNVESEKTSLHFEKIKTGKLINSMKSNKDNVNLYDQEIESHQLVKSKDIAPNQIDTKISNFAKNKCAMKDKKLQNNYPSTSSKPSKSKITKEYLKYNDEKNEPPIPLASTKMTKRLRSKQIKVESIPSSTTSSTSEIIEDCFDNVSKKRSKCQNKNLKKRCVEKVQKNYSPVSSKPIKSIAIKKEFPCSNDERNKLPNPLTSTKMTTRLQSKQVKVKSISSNTSAPTSEIIEDCFDNVSKKRSKCQNKNLKKRCVEKVQKNYSPVSSKPIKSIAIKKEFPCSNDEKNKLPNPLPSTKMTTRLQSKQLKVESISSNTSAPTSEIIEDCFDNVSKKRSKCQNKNLKKRCVEKVQKNYSPVSSKPIKSVAIKKEFPCSNDEKNKLPNPLASTKMTTRLQSKQLKVEQKYLHSNNKNNKLIVLLERFDIEAYKKSLKNQKSD